MSTLYDATLKCSVILESNVSSIAFPENFVKIVFYAQSFSLPPFDLKISLDYYFERIWFLKLCHS